MFYLIGLIFLLVKIAIQATVFSILIVFIVRVIERIISKKLLPFKFIFWIPLAGFIGFCMFIFSFTYWGERGLGDYARIPIGNGYDVSNIDGTTTYFEDEKKHFSRQALLDKFIVKNNKLVAEFEGFNSTSCTNCILVFDSNKEQLKIFKSDEEYRKYAFQNDLPKQEELQEFFDNYQDYWGRWRFWVLP